MGDNILGAVVAIVTGITGVAILAVILSKNSNTVEVLKAATGGYSGMLGTALSPITGGGNSFTGGGGF